jgi:hypothetical protein
MMSDEEFKALVQDIGEDAYALKTGVSAYHLRQQGMTFQSIAEIYQAQGHKTSRGKNTWNTTQVRQLILRYTRLTQEAK